MLELLFFGAVSIGLVNLWCTPSPETEQLIKDAKYKEGLKKPMDPRIAEIIAWEDELNRRYFAKLESHTNADTFN